MYVQEKQRSMELLPLPCPQRQNLQKQQPVRLRFLVRKIQFPGEKFREQAAIVYIAEQGTVTGRGSLEVKSNVSSYQDSQIRGITSYTYSVRAYRNVDGKKVFGSYKAEQSCFILSGISRKFLL